MLESELAASSAKAPPPAKAGAGRGLLVQAGGALLWGVFLSVTPFELLLLCALLWIPLFFLRDHHRTAKYGYSPGMWVRLGVITSVMGIALLLPLKYEDTPFAEAFAADTVTLEEIGKHTGLRCALEHQALLITLPSRNPTLRQVMRAIETQTHLECRTGHCGNGATLLWGAAIMSLSAHPRD